MVVMLPDAQWRHRAGLNALLDALDAAGGMTRFVGGAVRDTLLGAAVTDVDLATRLRPDAVLSRLEQAAIRAVPTGIDHGTITAILESGPVEVTTLRHDVATDGRRATIRFADDWTEDAARRDFTINALFADPVSGEVHDYFGGLNDLRERRVRFIGVARERIAEDHLRILRFFRFQARFGAGDPDGEALAACIERANDLMALSRERIADELLKLLALPDPVAVVEQMIDHGILRAVLPEFDAAASARLAALVNAEQATQTPPDPVRRLAALLPRDARASEAVVARLKLSNALRKRLAQAGIMQSDPPRVLLYRLGREGARDALLLQRGSSPDLGAAIDAIDAIDQPRLPITGGALVARGLTAGPDVARVLRDIEQRWIDEDFPDATRVAAIADAAVDQWLGRARNS